MFGLDMTGHAHEPLYRRQFTNDSHHEFGQLDRDFEFTDDPWLAIAYSISEGGITFLGPIFWICLVYLFLVAEIGN
jgi:hypothetical protein